MRVELQEPDCRELVLDTRGLIIESVLAGGAAAAHSLDAARGSLGCALRVALPAGLGLGDQAEVCVHFATSPDSTACQFLEPAQTAGGRHPFLFTQCQAIHARSLVPLQDTPGAKITWTASVAVPEPLTALMSAASLAAPPPGAPPAPPPAPGQTLYYFEQPLPVAPYLIALAVGALESRPIGPRSSVWRALRPAVVLPCGDLRAPGL